MKGRECRGPVHSSHACCQGCWSVGCTKEPANLAATTHEKLSTAVHSLNRAQLQQSGGLFERRQGDTLREGHAAPKKYARISGHPLGTPDGPHVTDFSAVWQHGRLRVTTKNHGEAFVWAIELILNTSRSTFLHAPAHPAAAHFSRPRSPPTTAFRSIDDGRDQDEQLQDYPCGLCRLAAGWRGEPTTSGDPSVMQMHAVSPATRSMQAAACMHQYNNNLIHSFACHFTQHHRLAAAHWP